MTTDVQFGRLLTDARMRAGLSQTDVALRMADLGYSWHQTTISRAENGKRPLRAIELGALRTILPTFSLRQK